MSQENVDLHYRAIDAFNRRDLGAYLALMDPEVEFTPYEVWVQGGEPYRGHAGVRSWWEESFAVFPDLRAEVGEIRDFGDRTFACGRIRGQGAGSGASIERAMWLANEWRDKKAAWWCAFDSEAEALEAAGLSEQAMSQENAEKLHEIYELLNTRFDTLKAGDVDDLLAFFDPEVVIEMVDAPDPETYRGHDGVRRWFNDAFGPWAAVHIEAEDIKKSGQWTVALLRTSLRGEASGVELELSTAAFHQFRGGRIVLDRMYLDRDEGLEAFALKE